MDYGAPVGWDEANIEQWSNNVMDQSSYHPHHPQLAHSMPETNHNSQIQYSGNMYTGHPNSSYATPPQQRPLSMPVHGYHPQYSSSSVMQGAPPTYASTSDNMSIGPYMAEQQYTPYPHHDQYHNPANQMSPDAIHSYRRLTAAEEEASAYMPDVGSPSNRRRSGSQSSTTRPQVPAKFECIACHARFSYESSAKRHQLNQVKRFRCTVCNQKFARVDYRNWHQRRCETGFRLSGPEQLPG